MDQDLVMFIAIMVVFSPILLMLGIFSAVMIKDLWGELTDNDDDDEDD